MPRANRYFIPGLIWHITHRCHKGEFLLKFARDRDRWLHWLFEAKKRYGLLILNFALTSSHIHLLVKDRGGRTVIPASMDLIAGRAAQEFNLRKKRSGAFWQDRYHATAVESGEHFIRCMVYIDLNMVRAGVVRHPREWRHCGFKEILGSRQRYTLIDWPTLLGAFSLKDREELKISYAGWVEEGLKGYGLVRDERWTESVAVGSKDFVERTAQALGIKANGRAITETINEAGTRGWVLREEAGAYSHGYGPKNPLLRVKIRRKS